MRVLLTGGAGYIGSHTAVELLNSNHEVIIADNFANSKPEVLNRIRKITGKDFESYDVDVKDKNKLLVIFKENHIDAVIHFAGFKAVGESVSSPLKYYRNNIDTILTVLECMEEYGVNKIVFSSSATVYGEENKSPNDESMKKGTCSNPYGWTKFIIEQIIEDTVHSNKNLSGVILRYFNPIGAHESGLIGEDPTGIPNNLMPYITQVAIGKRDKLTIFGDDSNTPAGTCLRDYIHVVDLAIGHVKALDFGCSKGINIINLGTGTPCSVLQLVSSFEKANNIKIKKEIGPRRPGDLEEVWANADKATKLINWRATRSLEDMCKDSWNWQKNNPKGYNNS